MDNSTVLNPSIPYSAEIPKGLYPGRIIYISGFIPSNSYRFIVNLICGYPNQPNCDTAFHCSLRFDEKTIVRNSYVNGNYQNEERNQNKFPLQLNHAFEMIILTEETHFKIALNGHHFTEFQHRLPIETIKSLTIHGDLKVYQIIYHSNFMMQSPTTPWPPGTPFTPSNTSGFALCTTGSRLYKMQPVYNPALPFNYKFQDGLEHETVISISGRPIPSAQRFTIDFLCGNEPNSDIALHINPRFDQRRIVKNSKIKNTWGNEDHGAMVFSPGVNFDLAITIKSNAFQMAFNGQFLCQFPHRVLPVKRITNMVISGDVLLTSARFF